MLDGRPGATTLTLIARQEIEYLLPIPYMRQPLDVRALARANSAAQASRSATRCASPVGVDRAAVHPGGTTIVLVDAVTERPRRINDHERAAWTPYLDAPIEFTRR